MAARVPVSPGLLSPTPGGNGRPGSIIGRDPRTRAVLELVDQVAATDAPVLITGESGTGKELVARRLHDRSARHAAPYVTINCGAIPESLGESELFGHVPGAFTGALARKRGKFEAAHRGTVFLDEVGEMSLALQVKLLRILQDGEFSPVGVAESCRCDVRVVAATNQVLGERVHAGAFRTDLYYRLNVIRVDLPPLRERPGDISLLAHHFARCYAAAYGRPEPALDPAFEERLLHHPFPGNVRELENLVHRAVVLCRGGCLTPQLLPSELLEAAPLASGNGAAGFHRAKEEIVERFERDYLTAVLRAAGGIVSRAAGRAGLSERNFHEKLRKYGIDGRSFRAPGRAPDPDGGVRLS